MPFVENQNPFFLPSPGLSSKKEQLQIKTKYEELLKLNRFGLLDKDGNEIEDSANEFKHNEDSTNESKHNEDSANDSDDDIDFIYSLIYSKSFLLCFVTIR